MAVYLVTGRLGAGKTLACVGRIRDALLAGRRVATNLDLKLEAMLPPSARKVSVMRLPDKPSRDDLEALGSGNVSADEGQNGLIVLDELGSWLNAREWSDRRRQGVIDWLIHSRKYGWDVLLIAQHIQQVDKQVRDALVEYHVVVRRLDRLSIPFFGGIVRTLTAGVLSGRLPRLHVAVVRYGTSPDAIVAERWVYRGVEFFKAYDTRQVFSPTYPHGLYSYLTPWHVVGRYLRQRWSVRQVLSVLWAALGQGPMGGWRMGRVVAAVRGQGVAVSRRNTGVVIPLRSRGRASSAGVDGLARAGSAATGPGGLSLQNK